MNFLLLIFISNRKICQWWEREIQNAKGAFVTLFLDRSLQATIWKMTGVNV